MLLSDIHIPISRLLGAGEKTSIAFERLGIRTVGELLSFWPSRWEDRSKEQLLADWQTQSKIAVYLTIISHEYFGFGNMRTLKLIAQDKSGSRCELICFNRDFLKNSFPMGSHVFVYGSFYKKYGRLQCSAFDIEPASKARARILPVYRLTSGLSQTKVRSLIQQALIQYGKGVSSSLPESVKKKRHIPDKSVLLRYMHAPESIEQVQIATHGLIFEEFFLYQYALGLRSIQKRGRLPMTNEQLPNDELTDVDTKFENSLTQSQKALLHRLNFTLTDDQKKSIYLHNTDIQHDRTISSLIQGDVGSGKTIVAFFVALAVIDGGGQVAFLAPTELLAKQHAENAAFFLENLGIRLAFLTGTIKTKGRGKLLAQLAAGELDMVIGTHALFSKDVYAKNIRLVIIDEQHRFGVLQRQAIIQKGIESSIERRSPHVMMMSATPIPRSLTLSLFGDMDISLIKTKPMGRKPVITYVSKKTKIDKIYRFVQEKIQEGRQAYIVAPLIEETEDSKKRSAKAIFNNLQESFPQIRLSLLHSLVDEKEQERIMLAFKEGKIDILVATSIIEVGVDVPNATCIVIEQAEYFGLAALHQLRGRVGRGNEQSYCFLVYGTDTASALTEEGFERLKILRDSTDGFEIAEKDLQLRGPGDVLGLKQSGYNFGFSLGDPRRDFKILQDAMQDAFGELQEM